MVELVYIIVKFVQIEYAMESILIQSFVVMSVQIQSIMNKNV